MITSKYELVRIKKPNESTLITWKTKKKKKNAFLIYDYICIWKLKKIKKLTTEQSRIIYIYIFFPR